MRHRNALRLDWHGSPRKSEPNQDCYPAQQYVSVEIDRAALTM